MDLVRVSVRTGTMDLEISLLILTVSSFLTPVVLRVTLFEGGGAVSSVFSMGDSMGGS